MKRSFIYAALLAVAFLGAVLLADPFAEVPVIDDWAYTYSVDALLETGHFAILDYSCRYNVLQALWGAAFCGRAPCTFVRLRWSTIVLAVVAILAFYDLLRRRTQAADLAFWTAAMLAFTPLFFLLSLSFMTDVPLLALVAVAFWLFDRGTTAARGGFAFFAGAVGIAVAAYLVRELAVAALGALLTVLATAERRRIGNAGVAAITVLAVVGMGAVLAWIASVQGVSSGLSARTGGLQYVFAVPPAVYGRAVLHLLLTTGALVFPLALSTFRRRDLGVIAMTAAVLFGLGIVADALPFGANEVLSPLGLGMGRALVPGQDSTSATGEALRYVASAAGALAIATVLREMAARVRTLWAADNAVDSLMLWLALGVSGLFMILWLWQDRYYLLLTPSALWFLALRARRLGWSRVVVVGGCTLFAVVGIAGTRENFALSRSVWTGEAWLRSQGVAASDIDAGYMSNGWRLYAHGDQNAPGRAPDRIPFLFSKESLPYALSTTPLPGYVAIREYRWPRMWLAPARLLVLRKVEGVELKARGTH